MSSLFFEFNSWLGFPPGVQVIFILGTSLLAGPEALETGPIQKIHELEHLTGWSDRTSLNYSVLEQSLQKYTNLIAGLSKVLEIDAIGK